MKREYVIMIATIIAGIILVSLVWAKEKKIEYLTTNFSNKSVFSCYVSNGPDLLITMKLGWEVDKENQRFINPEKGFSCDFNNIKTY